MNYVLVFRPEVREELDDEFLDCMDNKCGFVIKGATTGWSF